MGRLLMLPRRNINMTLIKTTRLMKKISEKKITMPKSTVVIITIVDRAPTSRPSIIETPERHPLIMGAITAKAIRVGIRGTTLTPSTPVNIRVSTIKTGNIRRSARGKSDVGCQSTVQSGIPKEALSMSTETTKG
jgi:hypothetical protein